MWLRYSSNGLWNQHRLRLVSSEHDRYPIANTLSWWGRRAWNIKSLYIKGTHGAGKYADKLKNIKRHVSFYPEKEFIDSNFSQEDIVYAQAPKGTVVICDTRGLHRGGKCLKAERVMGVLKFLDSGSAAAEI